MDITPVSGSTVTRNPLLVDTALDLVIISSSSENSGTFIITRDRRQVQRRAIIHQQHARCLYGISGMLIVCDQLD